MEVQVELPSLKNVSTESLHLARVSPQGLVLVEHG